MAKNSEDCFQYKYCDFASGYCNTKECFKEKAEAPEKPRPSGSNESPGYVPGNAKAIVGEWGESKEYNGYACVEIHIHPKDREKFLKNYPNFIDFKW